MALNFPSSPSVGDVYGRWQWNGVSWGPAAVVSQPMLPIAGGNITGNLGVAGTTTLTGTLTALGNSQINTLDVAGAADFADGVTIDGDDAATKPWVEEQIAAGSLWQGTWDAATNVPDLTNVNLQNNGFTWAVTLADPTATFDIPATPVLPGLNGLTVYNGDHVIWSDAASEFEVVHGSSLSLAEAQDMFPAKDDTLHDRGEMPANADWDDPEYLETGFWKVASIAGMTNVPAALQGGGATGIYSVQRSGDRLNRRFSGFGGGDATWEQNINPVTMVVSRPWRMVVIGVRPSTGVGSVTSLQELFALDPGLHHCRAIEDLPVGNYTVLINAYNPTATQPGAKTFLVQDTWDAAAVAARTYIGSQYTSSAFPAPNYGWSGWKRVSDGLVSRPFDWTPNVQMSFGDDLYGFRATGFMTQAAGVNFQRVINTGIMCEPVAHGGWVRYNSGIQSPYYAIPWAAGASNTTPGVIDGRAFFYSWGTTSGLVWNITLANDCLRAPYDVWVLYRRSVPEGAQLPVPDNIAITGNVLTWDAVPDAHSYDIRINGVLRVSNNTTRTYTIPATWVLTQIHQVGVMAIANNNLRLDDTDPSSEIFRNSAWSASIPYGNVGAPAAYQSNTLVNNQEWQALTITRRTGVTGGTFTIHYNPFLRLMAFTLNGVVTSGMTNGGAIADVSLPPSVPSAYSLRAAVFYNFGAGAALVRRLAVVDLNVSGVAALYMIDDFISGDGTPIPDGLLSGDTVVRVR